MDEFERKREERFREMRESVMTRVQEMLLVCDKSIRRLARDGGLAANTVKKFRGETDDILMSTFLRLCMAEEAYPAEAFIGSLGGNLPADELALLNAYRELPAGVRSCALQSLQLLAKSLK